MSTKVAQNLQNHWKIRKPYDFIRKNKKSLEKIENHVVLLETCINHLKSLRFQIFPMIFQFFQCPAGSQPQSREPTREPAPKSGANPGPTPKVGNQARSQPKSREPSPQPPKSREQSRQNANRPTLNMACSISIVFVYFSTKKHRPRGISTKSIPKHVHKRNSNNPNRKPQGQHLQQCDVEDFGQIQRMTTQTYKEFLNKHCKL